MPSKYRPSAAPNFLEADTEPESKPARSLNQLSAQSLEFLEGQYASYLRDRNSLSPDWRDYFDEIHTGHEEVTAETLLTPFVPNFGKSSGGQVSKAMSNDAILQERLDQLVRNYRVRGHIAAKIDPLNAPRPRPPELDPTFYGFTDQHLEMEFSTQMFGGPEHRTLGASIEWLNNTYCRSIGAQFMHIDSLQVRSWLQDRMEQSENHLKLHRDEQLRILGRLSDAVVFEEFIQKKFVGAKSFSLEGAESLIPLLDLAIERASHHGVDLIVLGMAHRGRLNVLANIMGKSPRTIFREFEDRDPERQIGRGDVKYHLGYSSDWTTTEGKKVHLTLCFNSSHLEFVNPVAIGRMRAKQDHQGDYSRKRGCAILIHGDAAFAGEGVVQETLNLSELPGYETGGTLHIIVNNQIGFTTSPSEGRSCTYATDVARMLQIPIFHVNGEDPEAVAQVVRLAMDFRARYHRDVIIDMYCFRRRGHNEGDEPAFTQPTVYRTINERKPVFENYLESLLSLGEVTRSEADEIVERRTQILEEELVEARKDDFQFPENSGDGVWQSYFGGPHEKADVVDTTITAGQILRITKVLNTPPDGFTPHRKLQRILKLRMKMGKGQEPFDWGGAESVAFGSLVDQGVPLRFSGQDIKRGTFSQRHAFLFDNNDGRAWTGLQALADRHESVQIHNSPLSEAGVVGFEYGYSMDCPSGLVIWEAQFGDFVNAAQVVIDQFISSAEDKWNRLSGLVMLLPHGFEGQGPEHSSARLERFLTLAAEDNMVVAVPTTPAQYFHLLRRHTLRKWKKPLIVMTPKSLLRHKEAVSTIDDLACGKFEDLIEDPSVVPSKVKRMLICSGKIYYELLNARRDFSSGESSAGNSAATETAIVRIEQLYPFPVVVLEKMLSKFPDGMQVVWIQEEPANMGARPYLRSRFGDHISERYKLNMISRPESASPATGSSKSHQIEQQEIIAQGLRFS